MRLLVRHVDSDQFVLRMGTDFAPRLLETGTNDQHPASSTLSLSFSLSLSMKQLLRYNPPRLLSLDPFFPPALLTTYHVQSVSTA